VHFDAEWLNINPLAFRSRDLDQTFLVMMALMSGMGTLYDNPMLEICDLVRSDAQHNRLLDVPYFEVKPGELIRVVGPTGSGKTILLRSVALLDRPVSGEVTFEGRSIDDRMIPQFRATVQYVAQRPSVLAKTVGEDIATPFALQVHAHRSLNKQTLEGQLQQVDLPISFLSRSTRDLSGGERQLVALLRTLATDPQVLLLDEPTAALDPQTTLRVEDLLSTWLQEAPQKRAIVWVSHDREQFERLPGRTCHLKSGRIETEARI